MPTQPHDASVKHFRHEAKALLRALEAGNAAAARRVSRNLPRLSGASIPDVLAADVGLQETQHVIACEQGYTQWAQLIDGGEPRFESITELTDADIRVLLKEVGPQDMAAALLGMAEGAVSKRHQAMFGMLQQLPEEVHEELRVLAQDLELEESAIAEAQQRIAQKARTLEARGLIGRQAPRLEQVAPAPEKELPAGLDVWERPLLELSVEELRTGLQALASAHSRGVLESAIPEDATALVWHGVRLTVDGTEPPIILDILEAHAMTALRQLQVRLTLTIEAMIATAYGDNPLVVRLKLRPIYTVEPVSVDREVEGTVELARQRLGSTPSSEMNLDELTELFVDIVWIARRACALRSDGFKVLDEVADSVDDEFIAWGLRLLAEHGRCMRRVDAEYRGVIDRIMDDMEAEKDRRIGHVRLRYQLLADGIEAIVDGRGEEIDEVLNGVEVEWRDNQGSL